MVAPPTFLLMTKCELRGASRVRRRAFVTARGTNIFKLDFDLENLFINLILNYKIIAAYRASAVECDVMATVLQHLGAAQRLVLPCVDRKEDTIVFRSWTTGHPLVRSALGFDQPPPTAVALVPDLILVPLVGFDDGLNRLGQGAGHYDRAFAACPAAHRVGIAWACQKLDAIPTDPWDVPLDAVLTETAWISEPNSRIGARSEHETKLS
jgi:5-formyltetrahydrofolate cyclo-ligase